MKNKLLAAALSALSAQAMGQNTFPSFGNTGIGTTTPNAMLEIQALGYQSGGNNCVTTTEAQKIYFPTSQFQSGCPTVDVFSIWPKFIDPRTGGTTVTVPSFTVRSNNNVGLSKTNPQYRLDVAGDGNFDTHLRTGGNVSANGSLTVGGVTQLNGNTTIGSVSTPVSNVTIWGPTKIYGYFDVNNHANISGNLDVLYRIYCQGNVLGQGYYGSMVNVSGTAYAQSFVSTSDRRLKRNIQALKPDLDNLAKVKSYQYNFLKSVEPKDADRTHFGFLAQEIQELFPNLVYTSDSDGHMGVNYVEFIPLLLEAYKETKSELDQLRRDVAALRAGQPRTEAQAAAHTTWTEYKDYTLSQNVPNPFEKETYIDYSISRPFRQAFLGVYNLNGQLLQKITVSQAAGKILLDAEKLENGIYLYGLTVDGVVVDTKRLQVNK